MIKYNMKRYISLTIALLMMLMLIPVGVKAAGSTSISISNRNPNVGDNFTVTITASEQGQMTISFDSRVISLVGCSVEGQSTSNSITINAASATLTFRADNAGSSGVVVSSPTLAGSSINVPVAGASESSPQPESQPAPQPETTPEPQPTQPESQEAAPAEGEAPPADMPEGDITIEGINYLVSERFPDTGIPAGFVENVVTINSKGFRQLTNGVITIIYLKRSDNPEGEGTFFIYDELSGTARPLKLLGSMEEYVIIKDAPGPFCDSLEAVTLNIMNVTYDAYRIAGAESEFYYIYGSNQELVDGWYAYDSLTGRISRADTASLTFLSKSMPVQEVVEAETAPSEGLLFGFLPISNGIFIGIIAFIIILIVVIIINVVLRRRERINDDDEDEDYYEERDDDEYEYYEDEEESVYNGDEQTQMLTDEERENSNNLIYESEEFEIRVKELTGDLNNNDNETGSEERIGDSQDLIDDIIKKASTKEKVDVMDLDDL